jgi:hypothetical protein
LTTSVTGIDSGFWRGLRLAHVERISAGVMQTAPIASERFQDALPLIPGVVRGPDGLLNINGSRSNQSALMFNDADGTDPVTGEDAIELPIDAVSTVQVRGAAFAPEFGLSAGAVTTVETERAGDAWYVTVNDLEPRVRRRAGEFRGIESWTPRFTFGGPLEKGKLSLLESVQYEYSQTRVFGLPAFESDTRLQSFESYTRLDWTLSATSTDGVPVVGGRRRPHFRRRAQRGRSLSHVRVARSAGEQAVPDIRSQRHGWLEGVQHHGPLQPARLSGEPRERQLRRLCKQRGSDVPREMDIRVLRRQYAMWIWFAIPLGLPVISRFDSVPGLALHLGQFVDVLPRPSFVLALHLCESA